MGGLKFAREHQPTAMKLALPDIKVPTRTTGIGTNVFVVIFILSIVSPPCINAKALLLDAMVEFALTVYIANTVK
jgi:hypothetical protein